MVTLSVVGKSWYREPWPWILMAGPLLVLAAGTMTVWLAIKSDDGLVAVDYYKRGLAINQETARARRAEQLGMAARAEVDGDANRLSVVLTGPGTLPAQLELTLVHPTRAIADQVVVLHAVTSGLYEGTLTAPVAGRRVLMLEDTSHTWRLAGEAPVGSRKVVLVPR